MTSRFPRGLGAIICAGVVIVSSSIGAGTFLVFGLTTPVAGLSTADQPTTADPGAGTDSSAGASIRQASHATNVTSCREINTSGVYSIGTDLNTSGGACIEITSSNVTLYGNGHLIQNLAGNTNDYEVGIDVGPDVSNVTVANVTIRYFENGIELSDVHNSVIRDVLMQPDSFDTYALQDITGDYISVSQSAVRIDDGSSNVTVRDSEFNSAGDRRGISNAVYILDSDNNTVSNVDAYNPGQIGIKLSNASHNIIENSLLRGAGFGNNLVVSAIDIGGTDNIIRNNEINGESRLTDSTDDEFVDDGIFINGPDNSIIGNDIHDVYQSGIVVDRAEENNTIRDNYIHSNWGGDSVEAAGVVIENGATGTELIANEISGNDNADAVYVTANETTITDNRILFNDKTGLRLDGIVNTTALNNTLQDNRGVEVSLSDTGSLTLKELHLATSGTDPPANVTFTGRNIELDAVSRFDAPAEPPANDSIGHYINITNTTAPAISAFELRYGDADAATVDESKILMYRHDGDEWGKIAGTNVADPATNTVTIDAPTFGLIAPFGPDVTAPSIDGLTLINRSGNLSIIIRTSERLGELEVSIGNSSGTVRRLTKGDFTERSSPDSSRYSTELTRLALGNYTVTVGRAVDDAGNSAPAGQNESILLTVPVSITSTSISDATDGDGTVVDGDAVSVSVTPNGENIQSVTADASLFGGPSNFVLSDGDGDGVYTGTFTVDVRTDTSGYTADVGITVTDAQGNSASTRTSALTVDTAVAVDNATASDATDGDGVVTDGDVVNLSAEVTGTSTLSSVTANASAFGASSAVTLTDGNGDGVYEGSFVVNGSEAPSDGLYTINITGTDDQGRTASEVTGLIRIDTSIPSVGKFRGTGWSNPGVRNAADNGSRVQPGDTIEFKIYATDFGTDIDRVIAYPTEFGIDSVTLTDTDGDSYYTGSAVIDGENASADGNYDIRVEAVDGVGLSANTTVSLYMNNTGNSDPPGFFQPTAENLDGPDTDVQDGDRINISVTASDRDGGISTIYANASAFGVDRVTLTALGPTLGGTLYNTTVTVDVANASVSADGDYDIEIVATDSFGNTANTTTNTLTLDAKSGPDTTAPFIVSAYTETPETALSAINDGTVVEAIANIDETGSGVASVTINASPLGAGAVVLTDANNDSEYNATFTVDAAQASADGTYSLVVNATDNAGNSDTRTTTDMITLDTTEPSVSNVTATNLNGTNDDLRDGDQVRIAANVSDLTSPDVEVDVPVLGDGTFGPISMFDRDGDGRYVATLTVDADAASIAPNGSTVRIGVTVIDDAGNTANGTSNPLTLNYSTTDDTTAPSVGVSTLTDASDGDGIVGDDDTVLVSVDASDTDSGIDTVTVDVSDFGGPDTLSLTDEDNDGTYDATFAVDAANASADNSYGAFVTVTDNASNQAFAETTGLTLDTTAPSLTNVTATNTDGPNSDVRDDDVIRLTANVSDATGVGVSADAGQFGLRGTVTMRDDNGDGMYVGTFVVNASSPLIEPNGSTVTVAVEAIDAANNTASDRSNGLTLNYSSGAADTTPPSLSDAVATDLTDGDQQVGRNDTVRVSVVVSDPNLATVVANASAFGAGTVTLTPDGTGRYNATFTVNGSRAAPNGTYPIEIGAADTANNRNSTVTNALHLNISPVGDGTGPVSGAPEITRFSGFVSDPLTLQFSFEANESLADVTVTVTNDTGATVRTLDETDLTEFNESGGYSYFGSLSVPDAGTYTLALTTATDADGNDGATGQSRTFQLAVEAASVQHIDGPAPDMDNVSVEAFLSQGPGGLLQVQLRDATNEFGSLQNRTELANLGVTDRTVFRINLTLETFAPRLLLGNAKNASWRVTRNPDGSLEVSIRVQPASVQLISERTTAISPGPWPAPAEADRADEAYEAQVGLAIDDMAHLPPSERNKFNGTILVNDAQEFGTPKYVNASEGGPGLELFVAAPHKTVAGENNTGFFEATLPQRLLDDWGVTDPSQQLSVVTLGTNTSPTVTQRSDGVRLDIRLHYSAGDVQIATADPENATEPVTPVLKVTNASVIRNGTTTVNVTLSEAPDGVSGYKFNLSVADGTVGRITGVTFPPNVNLTSTSFGPNNDTIQTKRVDLSDAVPAGTRNVTLARVQIVGTTVGSANLTLSSVEIDDDTGTAIPVSIRSGRLEVRTVDPVGGVKPTDPDGDGRYEDLNGNGRLDFDDIVVLFRNIGTSAVTQNPAAYDLNDNGRVDFDDVITLFDSL